MRTTRGSTIVEAVALVVLCGLAMLLTGLSLTMQERGDDARRANRELLPR